MVDEMLLLRSPARFALLATGRYLAILPGSMLRFSGKRLGLRVLPVDFPTRPWPIAILTLKKRTLSPVVHHFIDCVREVAKPLANQTALVPKRRSRAY